LGEVLNLLVENDLNAEPLKVASSKDATKTQTGWAIQAKV